MWWGVQEGDTLLIAAVRKGLLSIAEQLVEGNDAKSVGVSGNARKRVDVNIKGSVSWKACSLRIPKLSRAHDSNQSITFAVSERRGCRVVLSERHHRAHHGGERARQQSNPDGNRELH